MSDRQLVSEWRNENEATDYPFAPFASLTSQAGAKIPIGAFLDAALYPIGSTSGLYISSIKMSGNQVTVHLSDTTTDELASGSFDRTVIPSVIAFSDPHGRPAGVIVPGTSLIEFQSWEQSTQTFEQANTEFVASVCAPTPETGVRGILLADGSVLTGDVWLVGGDGVVLSSEELVDFSGETHQVIRIDIVGDPLFRRRLCAAVSLFHTPNFIRKMTIEDTHGATFDCVPDEQGNFTIGVGNNIAGDVALRIRPDVSGLVFEVVGSTSLG